MEIKKRCRNAKHYINLDVFFNRCGDSANLSGALRDIIYPANHITYSVEDNFLVIEPSLDESDYKVSIRPSGQAKVSMCYLLNFCSIPEKERFYLHHKDGDKLYFDIGDRKVCRTEF